MFSFGIVAMVSDHKVDRLKMKERPELLGRSETTAIALNTEPTALAIREDPDSVM